MNIITLSPHKIKPNTIAAIGFFDGVHKAHEVLIERTINRGHALGLRKAIITFDKHPKHVLFDIDYYYITPLEEKLEKLKRFDIDDVYVIRFDKDKASMDPKNFIDEYLSNLRILVCGFDFTFGKRASGNVGLLKTYAAFETDVVDEQTMGGYKIGSTHIRDLIRGGVVDEIPPVLGHYYTIKGNVIHGKKKGRTISYPTANIAPGDYLIPKKGVYATMSKVKGKWYQSMSSVGYNPTLNQSETISVESYLFDFNDDIYGQTIETAFIKRLRNEKKFEGAKALKAQIDEDGRQALEILKGLSHDALVY